MFEGMRALVTGGTGMIGRKVVELLLERGADVTSISMDRFKLNPKAHYLYGDLTKFDLCMNLTARNDYVFHIAGIKGSPKMAQAAPSSMFVPSLMMTTNILEACRRNDVKRVLFTSTVGAYAEGVWQSEKYALNGSPADGFPGWAKRMGELQIATYAIQYGLNNFCAVRPTNVYGEGDNFDLESAMVLPSLMAKIARGDNPIQVWGDGSSIRDFVYSGDLAEGILLAMESNEPLLNLGGARSYSIKEVLDTLQKIVKFNYEFLGGEGNTRVLDSTLARKLGYNPTTSLKEGLKKTWKWYKENRDAHLKKQDYFKDGSK